jgi:hypothetical protein
LVVAGVLSFCGGIALFGIGSLGGIIGASSSIIADQVGDDTAAAEVREAMGVLAGVGGLAVIQGIISVILAPAMLVVAYGLFQHKAWSRQGVVIVAAIGAVLSLINLLAGGGILAIVYVLVDVFIAYLFATDESIRMALSR